MTLEDIRALPEPSAAPGVYFLWCAADLVYIGRSNCATRRIKQHRWAKRMQFDTVTFQECKPGRHLRQELEAIELTYINLYRPKFNVGGYIASIRLVR